MDGLPLELAFVTLAFLHSAAGRLYPRDLEAPCTGTYASLNVDNVSPGSIYDQLQQPCQTTPDLAAMACRCNLVAYNLRMAVSLCQSEPIQSWSQWAQANQCNSSAVPPAPPFDISRIAIPKWATNDLSAQGTFDQASVLHAADSDKWTTIQILTPIIVGVGVAALAAIFFFLYRRRRRTGSFFGRGGTQKAWESAHLHGPRRFFGLIPDRFAVQPRERKETAWEIDGHDQALFAPVDVGDRGSPTSYQAAHQRVESRASGHSRTESTTSLITSGSQHSSKSFLTNIAAKFHFSSGKAYQSGTTKGPDYRRVHVIQENPGRRFKIDGSETPVRNTLFSFPPPPQPERHDSLPSVIDIRRPTTAEGSQRHGQSRLDSFPPPRRFTGEEDGTRTEFTGPQSDFTLGTADLMTPVDSLESGDRSAGPRHPSAVSPGSPFLPANRFTTMPVRDEHPSGLLHRNASTDSLAYQLYPREPPAF